MRAEGSTPGCQAAKGVKPHLQSFYRTFVLADRFIFQTIWGSNPALGTYGGTRAWSGERGNSREQYPFTPPVVGQLHLGHPEASFPSGKITDPQTEMFPGRCPPMGLEHIEPGQADSSLKTALKLLSKPHQPSGIAVMSPAANGTSGQM